MRSRDPLLTNRQYILLFSSIGIVYLAGLFLTLMENDAAQFAVMALRMHQMDDFVNLIKNGQDYLDKPHMHFWLAALSYKLFGVYEWSYRVPALLFTTLGAYSSFGLGKLLYDRETGKLAALIFVTTQAIILANHDVRTDAVLTGATIFAIWQLAAYINTERLRNIIAGAAGLAIAFSTKGQIAVFVTGVALLCHIAYTRRWPVLISWKILAGIIVFLLVSLPMFYAYYLQFDLHPEKLVNGEYGNSGIWFILWGQSFARLTGEGNMEANPDYLFFHHSYLWAFLPWSLIGLAAIFNRAKRLIRIRFEDRPGHELLTLGGILIAFHVISFSQFKLPHYLNILFPVFSIITAGYLVHLYRSGQIKPARAIMVAQYVISGGCLLVLALLTIWVFPADNWFLIFVYIVFTGILFYLMFMPENIFRRIILMSAWLIILVNFVLNTNHYPKLTEYQGGSEIALQAKEEGIDVNNIFILNNHVSQSLNFYTGRSTPSLTIDDIKGKKSRNNKLWIFGYEYEKNLLMEEGITWKRVLEAPHFRITMLKPRFINPNTRLEAIDHAYLFEIN